MFSFFKKKPAAPEAVPASVEPIAAPAAVTPPSTPAAAPLSGAPAELVPVIVAAEPEKKSWMTRLKAGLSKTSNTLSVLFVGAKIDDALYEELEAALLMSDA
ncbi:MAG: signal recognition particle-docking protein FtsY, partial [Janthinobacterium sp.]